MNNPPPPKLGQTEETQRRVSEIRRAPEPVSTAVRGRILHAPFFDRARRREGPHVPESIANSSISSLGLSDAELALLEKVRAASGEGERLTQRKLAGAAGLSLGMTNILVRRLVERGWLALRRHSAKSISYLLTPEGMAEMARRSGGYFERAARIVSAKSEVIEGFIVRAKLNGARSIVLVGSSAADFIIERLCETHGLVFLTSADVERWQGSSRSDMAVIWGERAPSGVRPPQDSGPHLDLAAGSAVEGLEHQ